MSVHWAVEVHIHDIDRYQWPKVIDKLAYLKQDIVNGGQRSKNNLGVWYQLVPRVYEHNG